MNQTEQIDSIKKRLTYYIDQEVKNFRLLEEDNPETVKAIFRKRYFQAESAKEVLQDILEVEFQDSKEMETIEVSELSLKLFNDAKTKSQNTRITLQTDDEFLNSLVAVWNQSNWGK